MHAGALGFCDCGCGGRGLCTGARSSAGVCGRGAGSSAGVCGRGRRVTASVAVALPASEILVVPNMPAVVQQPSSVPDTFDHSTCSCSRKRKAKPESWQRRQRTYMMRPVRDCTCSKKCITMLNAISPLIILHHRERYVNIRDWATQSTHLASMISISKYKSGSYQFLFAIPGFDAVKISICRIAFMAVFSLGTIKLSNLTKRMTGRYDHVVDGEALSVPSIGVDNRGRSSVNVRNCVDIDHINAARSYLLQEIKRLGVPSHYLQNQSSAKVIYMPSSLSINELWKGFMRQHHPESFHRMFAASDSQAQLNPNPFKPAVTHRRFHDLFASEFGYLHFYKPKTDECRTCLSWRAYIDSLGINDFRAAAIVDYRHHRLMAQMGYKVIAFDSEMAVESRKGESHNRFKWIDTLVFDHQKKFDVPHLVTKQARFGHQLAVFNFGVFNAYSGKHHFHLWSEWDGACGSDETIACLINVLESEGAAMGSGILNLISDSCGGQNKNRFMLSFAAELVRPGSPFHRFNEVNIKFPEVGHTFLPNDRIFGVISQYVKRHDYYDPNTLYRLIKNAFRVEDPQKVTVMTRDKFLNYGEHCEARYKNNLLKAKFLDGISWESSIPVNLRDDARWINFGRYQNLSRSGEMWIRHSLRTAEEWKKYSIIVPDNDIQHVLLQIKNDQPCSLDAVKMQSCFELAASIPVEFRHLYPAPQPLDLRREQLAVAAKNASKRSSRLVIQ